MSKILFNLQIGLSANLQIDVLCLRFTSLLQLVVSVKDLNLLVPPLFGHLQSVNFKELVVVVEDIGVEPMTPCVQGRCSSQLS